MLKNSFLESGVIKDENQSEWFYALKKPNTCPKCGEKKVVPIIYGEPTYKAMILEHDGKAVLGGCCILIGGPLWQCIRCNAQICKQPKTIEVDDDLPF